MKLFNRTIKVHFHSRQPITHFRIHRHNYYMHLVWWKLSLEYGQSHLIPVTVCSACGEEVNSISAGDEGWTFCEPCHQVEPETMEITLEEYEARQ